MKTFRRVAMTVIAFVTATCAEPAMAADFVLAKLHSDGVAEIDRFDESGLYLGNTFTHFSVGGTNEAGAFAMAYGPNGDLAFAKLFSDGVAEIDRFDPSGLYLGNALTHFSVGQTSVSGAFAMAIDPSGNLAFAKLSSDGAAEVDRFDPSGLYLGNAFTHFSVGGTNEAGAFAMAYEPNGDLAFAKLFSDGVAEIDRFDPSGLYLGNALTHFSVGQTSVSGAFAMAVDPSGDLAFAKLHPDGVAEIDRFDASGLYLDNALTHFSVGGVNMSGAFAFAYVPTISTNLPEPESWAMLCIGFLLCGSTLRRRAPHRRGPSRECRLSG